MFDLRKAKKSESGAPFQFTIDGENFTFPASGSVDWHVSEHLADGDLVAAVRMLLGASDFRRFDKLKLDMNDLEALFAEYTDAGGTSIPESSASTGS